jgi:hypothetical protein
MSSHGGISISGKEGFEMAKKAAKKAAKKPAAKKK